MLDDALDAAERLRELEDRGTCDELDRLLLRLHQEGDHPAEVAHLTGRNGMARMSRQSGIENFPYAGLLTEPVRDGVRVLTMLSHPDRERLETAEHEPAVER